MLASENNSLLNEKEYFQADVIADMVLTHLLPENLFGQGYDEEYFYKHWKCDGVSILPLFFEHKLANEFGSYQFYHQIAGKPVSRAAINIITKDDILKFIQSF